MATTKKTVVKKAAPKKAATIGQTRSAFVEKVKAKADAMQAAEWDPSNGPEPRTKEDLFNVAFAVVLAKTKLADGVDKPKQQWGPARELLFDVVSEYGWENTLRAFGSCMRLWAEIPGIVEVPQHIKDLCHTLAQDLDFRLTKARSIDRAALKKIP